VLRRGILACFAAVGQLGEEPVGSPNRKSQFLNSSIQDSLLVAPALSLPPQDDGKVAESARIPIR
jgi:hypothetical protein